MDPITTAALAEALGELMVGALKPVFARTARLAGLQRPSFYEKYRQHLSSDHTNISVLSLYNALPSDLNLVAIRDLLQVPIAVATIRQLTALHVLGEGRTYSSNSAEQHGWDKSQDRIHKAFIIYFTSALRAEYDLPVESHVTSPNKQRDHNRLRLANAVFDLLDQYSAEAARYLTANTKHSQSAMLWAQVLLADSALEAIARYTETSAGESNPTLLQRKIWLQSYRTIFAARHRGISLPDINGRNLIDYQKLYVYPQIRTSHDDILDLQSLIQDFQRSVLLGDPGAGKSTFSNVVAMSYVERSEIAPFHVTMREVEITSTGFSVVQQIERQLTNKYQLPPPQNLVEQLLIEGAAALIFDGLDELLDPTSRKQAAEVIEMTAARYPSTSILVTCRHVGYSQARLAPALFDEVSILPFDDERVTDYVRKWFTVSTLFDSDIAATSPNGWSVDNKVAEFMDLSSSIADIRDNPLLLSFICVMYRTRRYIPRNRPQLFDQCVDLLLRAWDATRGVTRDVADESYEFALAEVAEFITSRPQFRTGVPEHVLKEVFTEHLKKDAGYSDMKARVTASTMVSHCEGRAWIFSDAGLAPNGERLYAFTHSSFQEYFHAWWLTRSVPDPEDLAHELSKLMSDGRSQIAVQVAIHLCDLHTKGGGSRCISALIESGGWSGVLLEAADAIRLQPDVISKVAKSVISSTVIVGRDPGELLKLVNKDFRHSDGLASLYEGALSSASIQAKHEDLIRLAWLVTNASCYLIADGAWTGVGASIEDGSWEDERLNSVARIYASRSDLAFQVALRRGLVSVAAIAQLGPREFLCKLFGQCQDSISNVGDSSTVVWLIRVLGSSGSSRAARLWATQALRTTGLKVSPGDLAALPLSGSAFDSVRRSVMVLLREGQVAGALARMAGADGVVRRGLGILMLAALDVVGGAADPQIFQVGKEDASRAFREALDTLAKGADRMPDTFGTFLATWEPGSIWSPID